MTISLHYIKNLTMKKALLLLSMLAIIVSCKKDNDTDNPDPVPSTLSNGLVAHYPLDGNANDITTNQNNGIITGASSTTDRRGNNGKAYYFNGVSNYIRINNSQSLDLKENFSISAWINADNYLLPGVIVWNGDPAYAKDPYLLYFSNRPGYNGIGVRKDAGAGVTINEIYAPYNIIFSGVWCHIVGTCNSTSKVMNLYVNGELIKTGSFADMNINYSTTGFWTMLGAAQSSAGIDNFYKGKIDEVRIYNREITSSEVEELFKL